MYRITVNKIGKESRATKQWRKLTDKEVEQQYGYVEGEEEVDVEEKIYEQLVEDIDMQKIVKVVNSRKEVSKLSKLN